MNSTHRETPMSSSPATAVLESVTMYHAHVQQAFLYKPTAPNRFPHSDYAAKISCGALPSYGKLAAQASDHFKWISRFHHNLRKSSKFTLKE